MAEDDVAWLKRIESDWFIPGIKMRVVFAAATLLVEDDELVQRQGHSSSRAHPHR